MASAHARLTATLLGLAMTALGLILWGVGDMNKGIAEMEVINASSSAWGDVVGFESTDDDNAALAESHLDRARTTETIGIVLLIGGVVVFGSRWFFKPSSRGAVT